MTDNPSDLDEDTPSARWRELAELERWLDKPMLALAVAWLLLVVLELTFGLSPFLEGVGVAIWIAFILEFVLRLVIAPDRIRYLRENWLIAISLMLPVLRIFRAFRGLRVLRAARGARGFRLMRVVSAVNRGMNRLSDSMHRKGFGYVVALTSVVIVLGAAGMYAFERGSDDPAGITDYPSALWWTAMIVTTLGSGYWPVTLEGRILCVLLSLYALGILGYLAAALAAYFVGRDGELAGQDGKSAQLERLIAEVADLRAELREPRARG